VPVFASTLTRLWFTAYLAIFACSSAVAAPVCIAEREEALVPKDPALCASLEEAVRKPAALPQNEYEDKLSAFLRNFCHRNIAAGWRSDKHMRDTGPFIGMFHNGKWTGDYHGTHAPAVVWYSPDMVEWLKANRPETATVASFRTAPSWSRRCSRHRPPTARTRS
jgi:hypothetical protein